MKPTQKENSILVEAKRNLIAIVALCLAVTSFIYAKVEYRPITITDVSSRVLNTAYQATIPARWNIVNYSVSINSALTLSGGQTGTVVLQTSPDNITYTTVCTAVNGNTGTLTIGLNTLNSQTVQMIGTVPPSYYYKLVSSGTATISVVGGREVAF